MREDEFIVFEKKKAGQSERYVVSRKKYIVLMEAIKVAYADNNMYATKLVDILDDVTEIHIDMDRNFQMDVPFIYVIFSNGANDIISIPRNNKIIWATLNEFIKE